MPLHVPFLMNQLTIQLGILEGSNYSISVNVRQHTLYFPGELFQKVKSRNIKQICMCEWTGGGAKISFYPTNKQWHKKTFWNFLLDLVERGRTNLPYGLVASSRAQSSCTLLKDKRWLWTPTYGWRAVVNLLNSNYPLFQTEGHQC